jgi:hypothetical protein
MDTRKLLAIAGLVLVAAIAVFVVYASVPNMFGTMPL